MNILENKAIDWLANQLSTESTLTPPRFLGDGKPIKNGWFLIATSNSKHRGKFAYAYDLHGSHAITITFKSFLKGGIQISHTFKNDGVSVVTPPLDIIERLEKARAIKQEQAEADGIVLEGIKKRFFDRYSPNMHHHPYLKKKNANWGERFRFQDNKVFIPIFHSIPTGDGRNELISYQSIDSKGKKLFPKGGRTAGGFYPIGNFESPEVIYIVEGYATGDSVHIATGKPVLCAFSASNLLPVTQKFREWYPNTPIIIAGDDDQWHENGDNAGRTAAAKVLSEVSNSYVCHPDFEGLDLSGGPTDFNDLFCLVTDRFDVQTAKEEVGSQLESVVKIIPKISSFSTRYLPSIPFSENETTILHSPMGTGKTHGVPAWTRDNIGEGENFIAISPRITLIDSLINRFSKEGVELAGYREASLNTNTYSIPKLVICCNSLNKLKGLLASGNLSKTTVFIDEGEQVLRQLATMEELKDSYTVFKTILRGAKRVIIADANTDLLLPLIKETRGNRSMSIVKSTYLPGEGRKITYWDKSSALFDRAVNTLKQGGRVLIATDSKELTSNFTAAVRQICPTGEGLVVNSDTNHGKKELEFMQNPNKVINEYRFLVYSPALASGVSIDEEGFNSFDMYCGFFSSLSGPNPEDAWQQIGRVRAPVDWQAFIDGRIEKEEVDPEVILSKMSFPIIEKVSLLPEQRLANAISTKDELRALLKELCYDDYGRFQATVLAKEARLKNNFKESHINLAKAQGYTVLFNNSDSNPQADKLVAEAKKLAGEEYESRITSAEELTDKEFDKLDRRDDKTPGEVYAVEKYRIGRFYNQEVTAELVKMDEKGKFRGVVRKLEELKLDKEEVENKAIAGLKKFIDGKVDKLHFRSHLFFRMVFLQILATAGYSFDCKGEIQHDGRVIGADDLGGFIEWVSAHKRGVEIFHGVDIDLFKDRPVRLLQEFLGDIGLSLKCRKIKNGKQAIRYYESDISKVDNLNSWIKKRAEK